MIAFIIFIILLTSGIYISDKFELDLGIFPIFLLSFIISILVFSLSPNGSYLVPKIEKIEKINDKPEIFFNGTYLGYYEKTSDGYENTYLTLSSKIIYTDTKKPKVITFQRKVTNYWLGNNTELSSFSLIVLPKNYQIGNE